MNTDNERVEEFLKGIVLPEYNSDVHARRLRAQILSGLQARRPVPAPALGWKIAALMLGLLAAGALATGIVIQVRRCYFEGRVNDGPNIFTIRPDNTETNNAHLWMVGIGGDLDSAAIEQQRKDLEAVDALRRRNARELLGVRDTEVKGNPPVRMFFYKYVLADGRTWTNAGSELEFVDPQQIAGSRQRGQREILKVREVEFGGQRARTFTCRYVLSSGRAVTSAETDPEQPGPVHLTAIQWVELLGLAPEKGEFLGTTQIQMPGRTLTLQRYSFKLSDGTVVTRSEAQLDASKRDLSAAQWQELNRLSAAHKGEPLGTYAEDVMGKPFTFTRAKYVLSDGTEVIQSSGKPAGDL